MKRVIIYGIFDLLYYGYVNFLKRVKLKGDYLIVGLFIDEFNFNSKDKVCYFFYEEWKFILEGICYVDLVILEENWD